MVYQNILCIVYQNLQYIVSSEYTVPCESYGGARVTLTPSPGAKRRSQWRLDFDDRDDDGESVWQWG